MRRGYKDQLKLVRQFTGDFFSTSRGYSPKIEPNFGQRMAVLKYARLVEERLNVPSEIYTPKKREILKDVLEEVQMSKGYRHFTRAIIPKPPTPDAVKYSYDPKRPKGTRLVATSTKTKRRYYHIPAEAFLIEDLLADNEEFDPQFYEDIIEQYAEDAQFFLIQAGESFMWGSALGTGGSRRGVAEKIMHIFRNYSADMFNANDTNSSYVGNWFRGVTAFTDARDALPVLEKGLTRQAEFRAKFKMGPEKYRRLKDGSIGVFRDGVFIRRFWLEDK